MNNNIKWYIAINCFGLLPICADFAARLGNQFKVPFPIIIGCGILMCLLLILFAYNTNVILSLTDKNFTVFHAVKEYLNSGFATICAAASLTTQIITSSLMALYITYSLNKFFDISQSNFVVIAIGVLLIATILTYIKINFNYTFLISVGSIVFITLILMVLWNIKNTEIIKFSSDNILFNYGALFEIIAVLCAVAIAFDPINFRNWSRKDLAGIYAIALVMGIGLIAVFYLDNIITVHVGYNFYSVMLANDYIYANQIIIDKIVNLFILVLMIVCICTNMSFVVSFTGVLAKERFFPTLFNNNNDNIMYGLSLFLTFVYTAVIVIFSFGKMDNLVNVLPISVLIYLAITYYSIYRKLESKRAKVCNLFVGSVIVIVLIPYLILNMGYGAIVTLCVILFLSFFMLYIKYYYTSVEKKLHLDRTSLQKKSGRSYSIIVISYFNRGVFPAVNYAKSIAGDCRALYITDDYTNEEELFVDWEHYFPDVPLVTIKSENNKNIIKPILDYIKISKKSLGADIMTVVIPEYIPKNILHNMFHRNYAFILKQILGRKKGIITTTVPYRSE